jgi:undecaprenol kinase
MKGFSAALNGLRTAFKTEINMKSHIATAILVLLSGWYFRLSDTEWVLIMLCIGMVISAEMLNTAIEYLVNFISPEIHPEAGKIKDISAGAVLIAAASALISGLIIFLPKVASFISR